MIRYEYDDGETLLVACTIKAIHSRRKDYTVESHGGIRMIVTDAQIAPKVKP